MNFPDQIEGDSVLFTASTPTKHWPKGYTTPNDGVDTISPVNRFVIVQSQGIDDDLVYRVWCLDDNDDVVTGDCYYTVESAKEFLAVEYGLKEVDWIAR